MLECDGGQANLGRRDKFQTKVIALPSDCLDFRLPPERVLFTLGRSSSLHDNRPKNKGQSLRLAFGTD